MTSNALDDLDFDLHSSARSKQDKPISIADECIEGEHYVLNSPSYWHQLLIKRIGFELDPQMARAGYELILGPLPVFVLSDLGDTTTFVKPDIFIVDDDDKLRLLRTQQYYYGAPLVIFEVLSIDRFQDCSHDLRIKADLYYRAGVKEYWTLDGALKNVTRLEWSERGYIYRPPESLDGAVNLLSIAGCSLDCSKIFASLELDTF